ncbi:MAG: hypothetical protein VKI39_07695 [Synechococcus sp.]|nr:hypothetical protein [Synechococcus sp.]
MYTALTPNKRKISIALLRFTSKLEDWCNNSNIYLDAGILEYLSDAVWEVPDGSRYIVWTTQSERGAHLTGTLNLTWGFDGKSAEESLEFANEIIEQLQRLDLTYEWEYSLEKTINVNLRNWAIEDENDYSILGLLVLPGKYSIELEDRYGWNESNEYGLEDLPEDIGHCYVEIRDGESLLDAVKRESVIPIDEILAYQRCLSDEASIFELEPYTHWKPEYT